MEKGWSARISAGKINFQLHTALQSKEKTPQNLSLSRQEIEIIGKVFNEQMCLHIILNGDISKSFC